MASPNRFSVFAAAMAALAMTGCMTKALRPVPLAAPFRPVIEAQEAAEMIAAGGDVVLLDLRPPEDRARIRVRGSRRIEFREWQQKLRRDPGDPRYLTQ